MSSATLTPATNTPRDPNAAHSANRWTYRIMKTSSRRQKLAAFRVVIHARKLHRVNAGIPGGLATVLPHRDDLVQSCKALARSRCPYRLERARKAADWWHAPCWLALDADDATRAPLERRGGDLRRR